MPEAKPKTQHAVALKFQMGKDSAPQVLAKGKGKIAEKILETAREHGIPLYEDPELVEILAKLDLGNQISPELFQAVAEVLIFIYRMNMKKMGRIPQATIIPLPKR
jgi:flagellar biosynthesis protein